MPAVIVSPVMKATILLLLTVSIAVSSCWDLRNKPSPPPKKVWGYKAIFTTDLSLLTIESEPPRDVTNPAKIYVKGNLIFQNDLGFGVHVIDNTDPRNPIRIGFIRIHGNSEMSIQGNYMYANCIKDLVVVDISDWQNAVEVKRIKDAFANGSAVFGVITVPVPERNVFYECDVEAGPKVHIGWVRDSIYDNNCLNP